MTKNELTTRTNAAWQQTHDALQMVWDATNKGQRQKLLKNPEIKALMERYQIITEAEA